MLPQIFVLKEPYFGQKILLPTDTKFIFRYIVFSKYLLPERQNKSLVNNSSRQFAPPPQLSGPTIKKIYFFAASLTNNGIYFFLSLPIEVNE